ncbi:MAG: hypothetical protein IRZ05_13090 [Micromonosporaceae bacterium]|nr:hypothetical protein [Micromonosporaceae bacterium]
MTHSIPPNAAVTAERLLDLLYELDEPACAAERRTLAAWRPIHEAARRRDPAGYEERRRRYLDLREGMLAAVGRWLTGEERDALARRVPGLATARIEGRELLEAAAAGLRGEAAIRHVLAVRGSGVQPRAPAAQGRAATRQRPREHRRAARRSGARAPGRPSAGDADAGDDPPSLRRCRACGEPFRPLRRDSRHCYSADCRRRRAAAKVARHRGRRAVEPSWVAPERRAIAAVRAGLCEPAEALAALVIGIASRGLLAGVRP